MAGLACSVTCCHAAKILHDKQHVHRNLRVPNVVQLGPEQFTVIDLESVARVSDERLPEDFELKLRTRTPSVLNRRGCFTPASDMHCIGQLADTVAPAPSRAPRASLICFCRRACLPCRLCITCNMNGRLLLMRSYR